MFWLFFPRKNKSFIKSSILQQVKTIKKDIVTFDKGSEFKEIPKIEISNSLSTHVSELDGKQMYPIHSFTTIQIKNEKHFTEEKTINFSLNKKNFVRLNFFFSREQKIEDAIVETVQLLFQQRKMHRRNLKKVVQKTNQL